ncbi:MAG: TetR/AcrR family transcriptional regulator [Bacteroidia bacterium]|nr:TetR/AcrR family transcriptional regulator [Bacteroidia bacterium]
MKKEPSKSMTPRTELKVKIITAATEAFALKGIKSVTMDEIAASLGISKRTLYEVFPDKEALLRNCFFKIKKDWDAYFQEVLKRSDNVLEVILDIFKKGLEAMHSMNKRFFEEIRKYPRVHEMIQRSRMKDSEHAIAFLKLGVEQGLFRSDVNYDIVNILLREQFEILLNTDLCKDYSFVEVYESIMFTFLRGISTEVGLKKLEEFMVDYRQTK